MLMLKLLVPPLAEHLLNVVRERLAEPEPHEKADEPEPHEKADEPEPHERLAEPEDPVLKQFINAYH